METKMDVDVVVIGGGAAGLSGAITLARARRRVLVLDAGEPRNTPADGVHAFLSRDGMPPGELLDAGRAELASYGGTVRAARAVDARVLAGGFEVRLEDGDVVTGRRLLVTTGLVDELPEVPGLREHWGGSVVHCPYCHGWEVRDEQIAVLASGPMAVHQALLFSQLSDDVTLLLNGRPEPSGDEARRLAALGIDVVPGPVTRVLADGSGVTGVEVGGAVVPCRVIVVGPHMVARSAVLASLGIEPAGLEVDGHEVATYVPSEPATGRTSVAGVHVAGNVTDPQAQVVTAAAAGVKAAANINLDLVLEDADALVTAWPR